MDAGIGRQRFDDGTYVVRRYEVGDTSFGDHTEQHSIIHDFENYGDTEIRLHDRRTLRLRVSGEALMYQPEALAELAMGRLAATGADLMFGVPGGGPNIDMIVKGAEVGMRFILTHGESAACIAAGAYGKLTGTPGVVGVTRGPGVTAAATGMAQATLDRFPVVLLSDAIPLAQRDRIAHQRLDQKALMAPLHQVDRHVGFREPGGGRRASLPSGCCFSGPVRSISTSIPPLPVIDLRNSRHWSISIRKPSPEPGIWSLRPAARYSWWGPEQFHTPERCAPLVEGLRIPALVTYQAKGSSLTRRTATGACSPTRLSERGLVGDADLVVAVELDPVEPLAASWPYRAPVLSLGSRPLTDSYYPFLTVEVAGPVDAALDGLRGSFARLGLPGPDRRQMPWFWRASTQTARASRPSSSWTRRRGRAGRSDSHGRHGRSLPGHHALLAGPPPSRPVDLQRPLHHGFRSPGCYRRRSGPAGTTGALPGR